MTPEQKLRLKRIGCRLVPLVSPTLVALFPIMVTLSVFRRNWTSVPYEDDWYTPGTQIISFLEGNLHFVDLFRQHNESRLLFPNLCNLFLVAVTGRWDSKDAIVLTFGLACVGSFLLFILLLRTTTLPLSGRLWAWSLLNAVLFCPAEYENFLWGIFFVSLTPGVALLAAMLVNLSDLRFAWKVIANSILAFVATYSFANGMLLWLLAVPLRVRPSAGTKGNTTNSIGWYAVYLLFGLLAVTLYFRHFTHPAQFPQFTTSINSAVPLFHFLLLWLGNVFAPTKAEALFCGCVSLAGFAVLTVLATKAARRQGNFWRFYPWLTIAAYGLISGAIVAFGRLGLGLGTALGPRYSVVSLFFYIGLAGLAVSLHDHWIAGSYASGFRGVFARGLVIGVFAGVWLSGFSNHLIRARLVREERRALALAVRWIPAIPDNPDLALSKVPPKVVVEKASALSEYDALRPRFVSQSLVSMARQVPSGADSPAGSLTTARFGDDHRLLLTGIAWLPYRDARADCVVVGYVNSEDSLIPFTVFKATYNQESIKSRFDIKHLPPNGFAASIDPQNLPMGDCILRAWAVDLRAERMLPLAGGIAIHNEPVQNWTSTNKISYEAFSSPKGLCRAAAQ